MQDNIEANDTEDLEVDINQAREAMNLREELAVLSMNPTFKKLFLEGYLRDNVLSLTMQMAYPQNESPERQAELSKSLRSAADLNAFMIRINQGGNVAEASLKAAEEEREREEAELAEEAALNGEVIN